MTSQELFVEISKAALDRCLLTEDCALACMVVLHTCDFVLRDDCTLDDVVWTVTNKDKRLHAVTQRHAAEIVATATGHVSDSRVIDMWYGNYSSKTPYEMLESVPERFRNAVDQCRTRMLLHPLVVDVVEAD